MDPIVLWILLGLFGGLALWKGIYIASVALALPVTGGALFTSTHRSKIDAILDALPMEPDRLVMDLGCGDGRFLAAAVKRYGVRAIGYEVNLWAYLLSQVRHPFLSGRIRIERSDFWKASLKEADVVFCYLFPDAMGRLARKAETELKEGALLISCHFPLPGWDPKGIIRANHPRHGDPIYLYERSEGGQKDPIRPPGCPIPLPRGQRPWPFRAS